MTREPAGTSRPAPANHARRPDRRRVRSSRNDAARSMPASARPAAAAASTADGFAARPSRGAHHDNGRIDPTGLTPALGTSGRSSRLVFGNGRRHLELVTARAALEDVRHRVTAKGRLPHPRARPTTHPGNHFLHAPACSCNLPFRSSRGIRVSVAVNGPSSAARACRETRPPLPESPGCYNRGRSGRARDFPASTGRRPGARLLCSRAA